MFKYSLYTYLFIILLFVSIVFGLLIITFINYQQTRLIEAAIQEKVNFAKTISDTVSSLIWIFRISEFPGMDRLFFNQMAQFPDVVFVRQVSISGAIRKSSAESEIGQYVDDPDTALSIQIDKPIIKDTIYQDRLVKLVIYPSNNDNTIWLGFSLQTIYDRMKDITFRIIVMGGGVFLLLISVLYFLFRLIIDPLKRVIATIRKISGGDLDARIRLISRTEIGDLAINVNKMAENLKEAREREKMLSKMKSEFISIAAHQLRTPLSAIKWTLRMLMDEDVGKLKPEQKDFLTKGYDTNERMIRLVSDLLDVARIEEGRFGYNFSDADLIETINLKIQSSVLAAQRKNIVISFRRPTLSLPKIRIDPEKVGLALENLLDNAINYTHPNGSIEVTVQKKGDFLEVAIKDTGVGIPKHQINRLFTKFFRGENVMRMQTEGSGLGLFIVRNIIKRHGGDIWVESTEGKGTTFYFTLPIEEKLIPRKEEVFEEFITGF